MLGVGGGGGQECVVGWVMDEGEGEGEVDGRWVMGDER